MSSVGEMLLGRLIDRSHLMDPYMINAEAADAVELIGGRDLVMYLVDYGQRQLMPIVGSDQEEPLDIEGTVAGKAFVSGDLIDVEAEERHRLWVPLIDGADRVGVVELTLDRIDDDLRRLCLRFASLLTQFMITKGAYTDLYERSARGQQMTVAAELQWRQVPPLTFTTRRVAVAGILEPAYGIGGDAFDYSHNEDVTDLVILDSMGHGLTAAWPASLTLATLRQCRTQGLGLVETYLRAGDMIRETFDSGTSSRPNWHSCNVSPASSRGSTPVTRRRCWFGRARWSASWRADRACRSASAGRCTRWRPLDFSHGTGCCSSPMGWSRATFGGTSRSASSASPISCQR